MKNNQPLIDTNILVYAYDRSEGDKHQICRDLVAGCWRGSENYTIALQNLSEYYVVVTKRIQKPLLASEAASIVQNFLEFGGWRKINSTEKAVSDAMELNTEYGIPYWDALLAASMRAHQIHEIVTENDRDFKKIPWIKTTNPLK